MLHDHGEQAVRNFGFGRRHCRPRLNARRDGAGAVVLKVADCRLADIDGRRCYLSLDKRCKRKDQWDVGLCSKSREENAGQKPRAVYGRRKMTTREVKCALVSE